MSLEKREKRFSDICKKFNAVRPGKLQAYHKIHEGFLTAICNAAKQFISKHICYDYSIFDEKVIFENIDKIQNITPNGKILPKPHSFLEYNLFLKSVCDLIKSLEIDEFVKVYLMPNLRYKDATPKHTDRNFSTETAHLEAWVGHSKDTITLQLPLFGDLEGNYTALFSPPENFDESWLEPLESYKKGAEIAKKYHERGNFNKLGIMKIFEASTLHQTVRKKGCGPRVSLDMVFVCNENITKDKKENLKEFDNGFPPNKFLSLGSSQIFYPKDTMSGRIEKQMILEI